MRSLSSLEYTEWTVNYFLAKTEPKSYSISDLERDRTTVWDGIKNPQAIHAVRTMKPGDRILIYHSGGESAITGLAKVTAPPRPDPKDPKSAVVDIQYVARFDPPTLLSEIKQTRLFDDWALVRQGRLSTMAVPPDFIAWLRKHYPTAGL